MKKNVAIILTVVMMFMSTYVSLGEDSYEVYAEKLSTIGVFVGTGDGYDLDREPTRLEGLIMLIRLLGVEEEAKLLNNEATHFTDVPDWGRGYVNYGYANGLTNGVSDTEFGSFDKMQTKSYMTFLLRALGYDDKAGDFSWSTATDFALSIGLIDENSYFEFGSEPFLRGNVAKTSYDALMKNVKSQDTKLIDILVAKGAVDGEIAANLLIDDTVTNTVSEKIDLAKLADSCVYLEVTANDGSGATGSGFYISSDGKIVTNYHVIENAESIVVFDNDGTTYNSDVTVLGYDIFEDIAILKINTSGKQAVTLGNSDNITLAEKVYAIGSPVGLINTISEGIISAIRAENIQTSAAISPGSSGGALFDESGSVIGITYAGIIEGENLGFVIPINKLADVDVSTPVTLAQLSADTTSSTESQLVCEVYNDGDSTYVQWNDLNYGTYYLYSSVGDGEFELVQNINGSYSFEHIEGNSSVVFTDLSADYVYGFIVQAENTAGETIESEPCYVWGPVQESVYYTASEFDTFLNENLYDLILNSYEIPIDFFDVTYEDGVNNVYAYIDNDAFLSYLDSSADNEAQLLLDYESYTSVFQQALGTEVFFMLLYTDTWNEYPEYYSYNAIYSEPLEVNYDGSWNVFFPVIYGEMKADGYYTNMLWYE